jgi:hypothetical protein
MNIYKKRFGQIMTKEMEETVLNDTKQMNKLYEEIEELKKNIKEKNIEINLLNEQNKMYLNIIQKNNIKIENFVSDKKDNGPKILDFNKMNEVLNNENNNHNNFDSIKSDFKFNFNYPNNLNIKNQDLENDLERVNSELNEIKNKPITPPYSPDNKINEENIKNKIKQELEAEFKQKLNEEINSINQIKDKIISELQEKNKSNSSFSQPLGNTTNKSKTNDKSKELLIRFPINKNNDEINENIKDKINNNKEIKELFDIVKSENAFRVKYQYEIATLYNKNKDEITLDDILDYKIKNEGLKHSEKSRLKYKMERSKILYEEYGNDLNRVVFQVSHLGYMNKKEWSLWKIELDKIMESLPPIPCPYIWKKGKDKGSLCSALRCKKHGFII